MKLYVWYGDDVTSAWHDDGVIVVLANNIEEARSIVHSSKNISPFALSDNFDNINPTVITDFNISQLVVYNYGCDD